MSTIATLTSGETGANSLTDINTNFANLNTDKIEAATSVTLTNKTLTAPVIATIVNSGTLTLPTSTDTLIGRATTDTLTNKSISSATNTITGVPYMIVAATQGSGFSSPQDATTYYFGLPVNGPLTTEGQSRIYFGHSGTITKAYVDQSNPTTKGGSSAETSTINIRLNNTTDYSITSSLVTSGTQPTTFSNTSMSVPIVAGDYIEIKWTTPTWATNPINVSITVSMEFTH